MEDVLLGLYDTINDRKENPAEGSYTSYLFKEGLDKILKKVGEECSEVIIAAKNDSRSDLNYEICDLIYHLLVLMAQKDMELGDLFKELDARRQKQGNLKQTKAVDKNT